MKSLHLLRHAKSSWRDPDLHDRERPLSARGERAAALVARHLSKQGIAPDLVLCSPARRTLDTLAALREGLVPSARVEVEEGLYLASAGELLERLRALGARSSLVLVVGHNPGLHELAVRLAGDGEPELLARLRAKLPTGALVSLRLDGPWEALAPGSARLVGLVAPKDLG